MAAATSGPAAADRSTPVGYLVTHSDRRACAHGIGFDDVLGLGGRYVQSESAHLTAWVLVVPGEAAAGSSRREGSELLPIGDPAAAGDGHVPGLRAP